MQKSYLILSLSMVYICNVIISTKQPLILVVMNAPLSIIMSDSSPPITFHLPINI